MNDDYARRLEFGDPAKEIAYEVLEKLDEVTAERDVARQQRAELARANDVLESEVHRLRSELEAAHAKNAVLVNRLMGR